MVTAFVDDHRNRFGVEPICRVLTEHGCTIAPSTYYAARTRPASARAVRDGELKPLIAAVHADRDKGRGVAGVRKVWHHLRREGWSWLGARSLG
jgi:putative transposase